MPYAEILQPVVATEGEVARGGGEVETGEGGGEEGSESGRVPHVGVFAPLAAEFDVAGLVGCRFGEDVRGHMADEVEVVAVVVGGDAGGVVGPEGV